jgi:hypothetical protein
MPYQIKNDDHILMKGHLCSNLSLAGPFLRALDALFKELHNLYNLPLAFMDSYADFYFLEAVWIGSCL